MIYVDSSVALADLLGEVNRPSDPLWFLEELVSSRILAYEVWTTLHRQRSNVWTKASADLLLGNVALIELSEPVLASALDDPLIPLRTLDALHLATFRWLKANGEPDIELAAYDRRMAEAAKAMGLTLFDLGSP